ncbi:ABC transporter ATP-binding/permease protein [Thalassocella blandensis]|nr:ABC transporter ATP-binding/permease protein [Thalassocella blandensis]
MLKIQFKDKRQEPFWVVEKSFSIGQADACSLVIKDSSIAESHAKILQQGDTYVLKDLGSQGGSFVNNQRINQKNIACGDTIRLGTVELEVIDPIAEHGNDAASYWSLIADSSWLSGQEFPLGGSSSEVISLGRGTQCDIVFPGTHLSRRHAEITISPSHLTIRDLNSANGTFVNDEKVDVSTVFAGDRIRLDVYSFRVFGPGIHLPRSATGTSKALSDSSIKVGEGSKQWKSKPTSPGNREEINLYKRQNTQLILAGLVILGVVGMFGYIIAAVFGAE